MNHTAAWSPGSWQNFPVRQQPSYPDSDHLRNILSKISDLPPLVVSGEVDRLKQLLAECEQGTRFLLQGGDCAERFADCYPDQITSKFKILLQMSLVVSFATRRPIVRIGRIAGQFAKPRSAEYEWVDGHRLMSYRGDNINRFGAQADARIPDPERLLESYHHSAMTLNFIRALLAGGFADLHSLEHWDLRSFQTTKSQQRYADLVEQIHQTIDGLDSVGQPHTFMQNARDYFTSHEGLLLGYEQALTRSVPRSTAYYDLSAHMLWIGDRTRHKGGAHIEFFRGIANPIGIKVGPDTDPDELVDIIRILNPQNEQGKIVLITRLGHDRVSAKLPYIIEAVQHQQLNGLWCCDPMHGNTILSDNRMKTRCFDHILSELQQTNRCHLRAGTILGGVHFELTGENVTECLGGAAEICHSDLAHNYATYCDPRLNYSQSLEMAFLISQLIS